MKQLLVLLVILVLGVGALAGKIYLPVVMNGSSGPVNTSAPTSTQTSTPTATSTRVLIVTAMPTPGPFTPPPPEPVVRGNVCQQDGTSLVFLLEVENFGDTPVNNVVIFIGASAEKDVYFASGYGTTQSDIIMPGMTVDAKIVLTDISFPQKAWACEAWVVSYHLYLGTTVTPTNTPTSTPGSPLTWFAPTSYSYMPPDYPMVIDTDKTPMTAFWVNGDVYITAGIWNRNVQYSITNVSFWVWTCDIGFCNNVSDDRVQAHIDVIQPNEVVPFEVVIHNAPQNEKWWTVSWCDFTVDLSG